MSAPNYFGFSPAAPQYSAAPFGAGANYMAPFTAGYAYAPPTPAAYSYTSTTASMAPPLSYTVPVAAAGSVTAAPPVYYPVVSAGSSAAVPTSATAQSPSYSGGAYDSALYAAAASFIQGPRPPVAPGGGMSRGGRGRGRAGLGFRPQQNRANPVLHYCDICKISCAGPQTYKEHLEGQKHKKKEQQVKTGVPNQPLPRSKTSFRCDLCGVTCTGRDTYNAHVRGAKHQKTVKLHQQLGKPIPDQDQPTVIQPPAQHAIPNNRASFGVPAPTPLIKQTFAGKVTVPIASAENFAGTSMAAAAVAALASTEEAEDSFVEKEVQPVGEDYIEPVKNEQGKMVSFHCKLCDCKFNDLSAKDMHLKGRRHRLQYKKKVNPELEVDVKPYGNLRNRREQDRLKRDMLRMRRQEMWNMRNNVGFGGPPMGFKPPPLLGPGPPPLMIPSMPPMMMPPMLPRPEMIDDRYMVMKHQEIYPTDEELAAVQRFVANTERALKGVSDYFNEAKRKQDEEATATTVIVTGAVKKEVSDDAAQIQQQGTEEPKAELERLLKGVMRVGILAKGLLLKGETKVEMIVVCSEKPTMALLYKIYEQLPKQYEMFTPDKYELSVSPENGYIQIIASQPKLIILVRLTSGVVRDELAKDDANNTKSADPPDVLNKQRCLEALAALRRAKWFQVKCTPLPSALIVLRILRELCQRIPTWKALGDYAGELLVEKVLSSAGMPLSPGDAFRCLFESIASGLLLPFGPGLQDPCEKVQTDALDHLSLQQREDLTASAQHALRLIAFGQIYKVLEMKKLTADELLPPMPAMFRKRPLDSTESMHVDEGTEKKIKDEEEQQLQELAALDHADSVAPLVAI